MTTFKHWMSDTPHVFCQVKTKSFTNAFLSQGFKKFSWNYNRFSYKNSHCGCIPQLSFEITLTSPGKWYTKFGKQSSSNIN